MAYNTLGIARKSKKFVGTEGCKGKRVLVRGTNPAEVVNTASANAGGLAGVAFDDAADGGAVALSEYGYVEIETAGAVAYKDAVNIAADGGTAANRGRIKTVNEAATTVINLVGVAEEAASGAGKVIMVDIRRFGNTYVA